MKIPINNYKTANFLHISVFVSSAKSSSEAKVQVTDRLTSTKVHTHENYTLG